MRNKKTPRIVVLSLSGETATRVTNTIPNQVSAAIKQTLYGSQTQYKKTI